MTVHEITRPTTTAPPSGPMTASVPVSVAGALFHLGDGYAVLGDGEIIGTGVEISMDVRFSVRLLKDQHMLATRRERGPHLHPGQCRAA